MHCNDLAFSRKAFFVGLSGIDFSTARLYQIVEMTIDTGGNRMADIVWVFAETLGVAKKRVFGRWEEVIKTKWVEWKVKGKRGWR